MTIEVKSKLALLINKFSDFWRYFLSLFQIRIEKLKRNVFTVLVLLLIFINKDVKVSLFCYTSDFYSFKITKTLSVLCRTLEGLAAIPCCSHPTYSKNDKSSSQLQERCQSLHNDFVLSCVKSIGFCRQIHQHTCYRRNVVKMLTYFLLALQNCMVFIKTTRDFNHTKRLSAMYICVTYLIIIIKYKWSSKNVKYFHCL